MDDETEATVAAAVASTTDHSQVEDSGEVAASVSFGPTGESMSSADDAATTHCRGRHRRSIFAAALKCDRLRVSSFFSLLI